MNSKSCQHSQTGTPPQNSNLDPSRLGEVQKGTIPSQNSSSKFNNPGDISDDEDVNQEQLPPGFFQRLKQKIRAQFKSNQIEQLITQNQANLIQENKLKLVRKIVYFIIGSNFYYQTKQIRNLVDTEEPEKQVIQIINWVLWVGMTACTIISKTQIKFVYPAIVLAQIRNVLPLLDFDSKRKQMDQTEIHGFVLLQVVTVLLMQVNINFVSTYKFSVPLSFMTSLVSYIGQLTMFHDQTFYEVVVLNKLWLDYLSYLLNGLVFYLYFQYLLVFGLQEILKAWFTLDTTQKELIYILQSLQEAIITRNKSGFAFINHQGGKILGQILGKPDFNQQSCNFEPQEKLKESEQFIMNNQVFQLYEDNSKFQILDKSGGQQLEIRYFCLKQICQMKKEELKHKIFVLDQQVQLPTIENSPKSYVQIKKYSIQFGQEKHLILQIIDISDQVMFNIAKGEKKLLSLINATVSHEMRNPLNSIYSQNIKQSQINEKLKEFIDSDLSQTSVRKMRKVLENLHKEQIESIKVQTSSTKILNFLVNDMLDFAQIRSGKFRKDVKNFDINEAIQDVVNIQSMKAEFCGISLAYVLKNFTNDDHVICSDFQRFQQILLNLQSNALKFTPEGGSVLITCTHIKNMQDLEYDEHIQYFKKTKGYGMIQVSVKDSGIGIRKEDQDKLFKLFGFLENSKELNSKGVGLGLHISQKLCEELGGKILLDSEFGQGATFTFVIDLEKKTTKNIQFNRVQNPLKKQYPKITIDRNDNQIFTYGEMSHIPQIEKDAVNDDQTVNIEEIYCMDIPNEPEKGHQDYESEKTEEEQVMPVLDNRKPIRTMLNIDLLESEIQKSVSSHGSIESLDFMALQKNNLFRTQIQLSQIKSLPKRILVVDDEPYNFIGLKIILEAADPGDGISGIIDKANNGLQALKAIQKAHLNGVFQYGLIFMDCSMPIMDGYEASDKIRNYQRVNFLQQPMIVACTGHSEDEYVKKAWRHQMDEVIAKPANIEVIRCLLKETIQYQD